MVTLIRIVALACFMANAVVALASVRQTWPETIRLIDVAILLTSAIGIALLIWTGLDLRKRRNRLV
jgi:hypothetical protein